MNKLRTWKPRYDIEPINNAMEYNRIVQNSLSDWKELEALPTWFALADLYDKQLPLIRYPNVHALMHLFDEGQTMVHLMREDYEVTQSHDKTKTVL